MREDVAVGSEIVVQFRDTPSDNGFDPIRNEISRGGLSELQRPCGFVVEAVSAQGVFVRGDVNRDWVINLLDAIAILGHLYDSHVGPTIPCLDAADIDDNGVIIVTDVIQLLNFLFTGGASPALPFPNPGRDTPAVDDLPCMGQESGWLRDVARLPERMLWPAQWADR